MFANRRRRGRTRVSALPMRCGKMKGRYTGLPLQRRFCIFAIIYSSYPEQTCYVKQIGLDALRFQPDCRFMCRGAPFAHRLVITG